MFVYEDGKTIDTLEGTNPFSLANKVSKVAGTIKPEKSASLVSLGMVVKLLSLK